jgi:hypothetical protein
MSIGPSACWVIGLALLTTAVGCGASVSSSSNESQTDGGTGSQDGSGGGPDGTAPHDASPTADGSSGDAGGPHAPAVSTWVGSNVDADLPYADITYMLNAFDTPTAQLDANGYPVAGASGQSQTDLGFELPTGTYNVSYVGTGTLTVGGIGALVGSWQSVNGEQRAQIKISGTPGNFGNFLTLKVSNSGAQTAMSVHIYLPGVAYDEKNPFNPAFITALAPFRALRFMGWMATNNSKLANWTDRPASSHFGASPYGVPYEFVAELINQTGKDGWINVPELATSSFISSFASFMAQNLDFTRISAARQAAGFTTPFQLIVENSNETWNGGFSAYNTFLTAANANSSRYPGTYTGSFGPSWMTGNADLMKVGEYEADRLVSIAQAFQLAFQSGGHADAIAPVLSGWALGAGYSDDGLTFVQKNYGTPSKYVSYVALAPYFSTADDTTTGSLTTIFPAMVTNITSMGTQFQGFATLSKQYGIAIAAYEGGQGLTGTTNEGIKHLAQFDVRMNQTYQTYLKFWQQYFGNSLFMHFTLSGTPGLPENIYQYGFWGSLPGLEEDLTKCGQGLPTLTGTEAISSLLGYCPKYAAIASHVPQ